MIKDLGGKHSETIKKLVKVLISRGFREVDDARVSAKKRIFKKKVQDRTHKWTITSTRVKREVTYGHGWIPLVEGYLKDIRIDERTNKIGGLKRTPYHGYAIQD